MYRIYKNIKFTVLIKLLMFSLLMVCFSHQVNADIDLTKYEQNWIKENPIIKFTGAPNWLPYEAFKKDGSYIGIVAEHLKLIENLTTLKFNPVPVSSWTESLEIATGGQVSVISGDAADVILNKRFKPIDAYSKNPIVIIMDMHQNYVDDLNEIKNKKIAIIKGYGYTSDVFKYYPDIKFIEVENIYEGIEGVSNGQFDAMLATIALATYTISDMGVNNVRVVGKTKIVMELTLFVDKNKPILHDIINKALKSISLSDSNKIAERWVKQHYVEKVDYTLAIQIGILSFVLLVIFVFWNRRLSREIDLRIKIEKEYRFSNQRLLFHRENTPLGVIEWNTDFEVIDWNNAAQKIFGFTKEEMLKKHATERILPSNIRTIVDKVWNELLNTKISNRSTNENITKDGNVILCEWYNTPILDENRNTIGIASLVADITEQRSTELALLKSEELLEKAQVIAKIGHWKLNHVTGEVTGSDELFRIFGFPREDASLDTFIAVVHPDDREMDVTAIQRGLEHGESWDIEHRLICRDGTEKWVHAVGEAVKDDSGAVVELLGTVQDITKEKLSDIEFEQSSLRFKAMFESIPDAIVYADPERKIRMVNQAAIEMFGFDEAEMHGHETKMLYASHDDFKQQGVKRFNPNADNKSAANVITYKNKDGHEFPGETLGTAVKTSDGEIIGYVGIIRDISERQHVDDILRTLAAGKSESDFNSFMNDVLERLTNLYNCKYAFIGKLQNDNNHVKTLAVRANDIIVDNFEYHLDGTPCKDIMDLKVEIVPRDASILYPNDQMLIDMGIEGYYGSPLISSEGKIFGILSVMDTQELELDEWSEPVLGVFAKRVALEIEREMSNQELHNHQELLEEQVKIRTIDLVTARNEAERANEAKSEFLSSMSHELRTPLNAILGFGQMLELDGSKLSEVQQTNIQEILEAGHHLLNLINEVLDLAHIESGKLNINIEKIDVTKVLQDCMKLMSTSIKERNIEVIDNLSEHHYFVSADFIRLKQIFLNLISNAVKYNKESGKLIFEGRLVNEKHIHLFVTDTGKGLTENEISRLFNPFERLNAEENIEGTGIGLTITKHLIELMNGTMGVESTPGKGSTFWIELKIAE